MKFHRRFALLVMLTVAAGGVAQAQNPPAKGNAEPSAAGAGGTSGRLLTVEDYFRIKEVGDPQISPDMDDSYRRRVGACADGRK
jgi:hypothetical protein